MPTTWKWKYYATWFKHPSETHRKLSFRVNYPFSKNGQKCWSQPGFKPGAFEIFLFKALPLSYCSFLLKGTEYTQIHFKTIYLPKQIKKLN